MRHGVYLHIPFCEQRCYYCAFAISVAHPQTYAPYVERLLREIQLSGFNERPETIFLGGGTPSIIDAELITRILSALGGPAEEVSIEVNPGTLTAAKLDLYGQAGINRISLGVQSFNDEDLKNAGRLHSTSDVFRDIDDLRKAGFANIGIDLIAGLPDQTAESWCGNLDWIDRILPEHVSIYMLDAEERSLWGRQHLEIPGDELYERFYTEAVGRLDRAGYHHYEISNWARPGFECRHNLKYWTGAPYRGFGISAHSFSGSRRYWNTASLAEYAMMLDSGRLPLSGEEQLTRNMRVEEAFLLGLRRTCGFDVWRLAEELGIEYPRPWFDRLCEFEDAGWIHFDGRILKLTPAGWLLAGGITEELLWPNLLSTSEATP